MPTTMGRVFFLALCLVMHPFMLLIHADEVDALMAFKKVLNDPNNILQSWDPTLNICLWFNVECGDDNHVTRIDLGNKDLSGTLVPALGNLAKLQHLELYKNDLTGSIPPDLGNLTELVTLDLYNNALNGSIPKTLGNLRKLTTLKLNNNNLSGCFPTSVLDLVGAGTLKHIDVKNNNGLCVNKTCGCHY